MLIAREEIESAGKVERFGRNCISAEIPPYGAYSHSCSIFVCLFLSLYVGDKMSHKSGQLWISSMNRNVASRSSSPSAFLVSATQITCTECVFFFGWQLPTHVCQSFTLQIRAYQHEKVGEKVGENRGNFYLSPTVCQRVCRLLLFLSHTPTWVCPHEFANFSLPCEGRLTL